MKKYFLTTALMGTFIAPAFGVDKIITSANTCTVDVLGVSDNNAVANTIATWDLIDYTLNPGQYLNVTETSVDKTTCPAGSYCVGGGYTVETAGNSIAQCPTGYPNSANGASADTQCYTACTVATANIAHATAVSGNDYFGDGVDACYATACDKGYHVDGEIELIEKTPLIPVDVTVEGDQYEAINANGEHANAGSTNAVLTENNTWAARFDYGTVYGRASCQPTADNPAEVYFLDNKDAVLAGTMTMDEFRNGLLAVTTVAKADHYAEMMEAEIFIKNMLNENITEAEVMELVIKYTPLFTKHNAINVKSGADYSTDSTGRYCYCQIDGFMPTGGEKASVTSAIWFLAGARESANECASLCSEICSAEMYLDDMGSRAAMLGGLDYIETGVCTANTINIDWNPDNGGDHIKNMCTYEGSIELPTPDPVKPGYTFTGWKLLEENK